MTSNLIPPSAKNDIEPLTQDRGTVSKKRIELSPDMRRYIRSVIVSYVLIFIIVVGGFLFGVEHAFATNDGGWSALGVWLMLLIYMPVATFLILIYLCGRSVVYLVHNRPTGRSRMLVIVAPIILGAIIFIVGGCVVLWLQNS